MRKEAEEFFKKSLEIHEELGALDGMATNYGNLGLLYMNYDSTKAESMYLESLKLNEEVGNILGVATQYANMGTLYLQQGDLVKAKEYYEKSLPIFHSLNSFHYQNILNTVKQL